MSSVSANNIAFCRPISLTHQRGVPPSDLIKKLFGAILIETTFKKIKLQHEQWVNITTRPCYPPSSLHLPPIWIAGPILDLATAPRRRSVGRSVGGSKRSTCRADGTACFAAPRDTRRARKDLWPNRFQQDPFVRLVGWSFGRSG